jgi:hypothetical protein
MVIRHCPLPTDRVALCALQVLGCDVLHLPCDAHGRGSSAWASVADRHVEYGRGGTGGGSGRGGAGGLSPAAEAALEATFHARDCATLATLQPRLVPPTHTGRRLPADTNKELISSPHGVRVALLHAEALVAACAARPANASTAEALRTRFVGEHCP